MSERKKGQLRAEGDPRGVWTRWDVEGYPTEAFLQLDLLMENVVEQLQAVEIRRISSVTLTANLDLEGKICVEKTGLTLMMNAR